MTSWRVFVSTWLDRGVQTSGHWSITLMRWSLGIVFVWFGALKLTGQSPVADLVGKMTVGVPKRLALCALGVWETAMGLSLLTRIALPVTLPLLFAQQLGTFAVFLFQPREAYRGGNPLRLTDTGEFIVKNLVLLSGGLVLLGTLCRGRRGMRPRSDEPARRSEEICP